MGPAGLLVNSLGANDYAYIQRTGTTVAYYNAGYVRALRFAAKIAGWIGQPAEAAAWTGRIAGVAAAFGPAFWDASVGAYKDATVGPVVHPEDGNVFAVLAGLATLAQARSALDYLGGHEWQPYGATIADNDVWDGYPWGDQADLRVYPFIGYFDVVARYQSGLDPSALALIRREWGYMLANGPKSTMWETIGPEAALRSTPTPPTTTAGRAGRRRPSRATPSACSRPRPGSGRTSRSRIRPTCTGRAGRSRRRTARSRSGGPTPPAR